MRILLSSAMFLLLAVASTSNFGCSEAEDTSCNRDEDCPRGQICDEDQRQCIVEACRSLSDCPGSGRTCLSDTMTCSRKECGDADGQCPPGQMCMADGPFAWSCAAPPMMQVDQGMLPVGRDAAMGPVDRGMGPVPDMGQRVDMGGQPHSGLCQACSNDRECSVLGDGAQCTPIGNTGSFCTSACGPGQAACAEGFTCLSQLNQCVPLNYDCTVCPGRACQAGQVCDVTSGQCVMPRGACEPCTSDASCAANHVCRDASNGKFCMLTCMGNEPCANGYSCNDGACAPDAGRCDACDGRCQAPTPACIAATGMCGQCNNDNPCPIGQFCDPTEHTCSGDQPCECGNDAQCAGCGGRPICLQGSCVQCLDDVDCPARSACNAQTFQCENSPCSGVVCQQGSMCDAQAGRCAPGCNNANDCVDANTMDCNVQTGQCYYRDGTCDPGNGGEGVCPPGATCTINALTMASGCSCRKANPDDIFSMELIIGCHPGFLCFQLPMTPEGVCIESPF